MLPGQLTGSMPLQQSSLPRVQRTKLPTGTNASTQAVNARLCTSYYTKAIYNTMCRVTHRWEDNIKMDLQEVGGGRGDWMELAQDRDR